jgi:hypothetical protein
MSLSETAIFSLGIDEVLIKEPIVINNVNESAKKSKTLGANKFFICLMIQ